MGVGWNLWAKQMFSRNSHCAFVMWSKSSTMLLTFAFDRLSFVNGCGLNVRPSLYALYRLIGVSSIRCTSSLCRVKGYFLFIVLSVGFFLNTIFASSYFIFFTSVWLSVLYLVVKKGGYSSANFHPIQVKK